MLLQYHKLHSKSNQAAQGWLGRLWTKAMEGEYKEYDRLPREELASGLNNDGMIDKKLREVATLDDIKDAMSKHVLIWAYRVEAHRAQKTVLKTLERPKILTLSDTVKRNFTMRHLEWKKIERCKYCSTGHVPRQCSAYGKNVVNAEKRTF